MTKRIFSILISVMFVFLLAVTAYADPDSDSSPKAYVVDMADVLTDSQEEAISSSIREAVKSCKMDIVFVTVENLEGKSTMEYADDYYDYNGYGKNGVLLLVHFDNGEYSRGNSWISTTGKAIEAINDSDIQDIGAQITPDLLSGDYETAALEYVEMAHSLIKQSTAINFKTLLVWALIVGVIVTIIVNNVLKNQLKSVREAADASNYIVDGSMAILGSYDQFLYSTVTSTRRQTSSSSSSGSSTHTSSSGTTHGGGGF